MDTFQFSVATDVRLWVILLQTAQEGDEGCPLLRSPCVVCLSLGIVPAFVADPDGVGVIPAGMDARHFLWPRGMDMSVTGDVVMVADALVVEPLVMTVCELLDSERLVAACGTAVDDNEIDVTHGFNGLLTSLLSPIQLDMKNVLIKAVMIVMMKLPIFSVENRFINDVFFNVVERRARLEVVQAAFMAVSWMLSQRSWLTGWPSHHPGHLPHAKPMRLIAAGLIVIRVV